MKKRACFPAWLRLAWCEMLMALSLSNPGAALAETARSTFTIDDVRSWQGKPIIRESARVSGYRGIWFALGYTFEYGDKYSGGLGTYCSNHQPLAVYAPAAKKTFFTYGGTAVRGGHKLGIMVSYFDHATGQLPKPVLLYCDPEVDDPHDNAAIQLDRDGYIWVFKSGRAILRPGLIFRSTKPYSIDAFECVSVQEFTYPQVWYSKTKGFFLLFAKYHYYQKEGASEPDSLARELYWKTSRDGRTWSQDHQLAAFEGHYQTSGQYGDKIVTCFNWHPGSDNDKRTNLYYAQTTDWGKTWTTAAGHPLDLPLRAPRNPALLTDYHSQGKNLYTSDVGFDQAGNPLLLYVTSRAGEPGPAGDPREWTLAHWGQGRWETNVITQAGHNYDVGTIEAVGDAWRVMIPTLERPQRYGLGGEMALWISRDNGKQWTQSKRLTRGSPFNHDYARLAQHGADPFHAFWADGNPRQLSPSHLFFTNASGDTVWRLPYNMTADFARPERLEPFSFKLSQIHEGFRVGTRRERGAYLPR